MEFLREQAQGQAEAYESCKNRKVSVGMAKDQLFLEQFEDSIKKAFKGKLPVPKQLKKTKSKAKRALNVIISDTHYGSNLDPREVGYAYGAVEEARRTAEICRQTANYKRQYREETELNVHLLGDLIDGKLHDGQSNSLPVAEQVAAAIRILAQALRFFSSEFHTVKVHCASGNHGRSKSRHPNRAVDGKYDSVESMIYVALREVVEFLPNTVITIGYSPSYTWDSFGLVGYATHGDNQVNFGYPGKSINTENIARQIDKLNNARIGNGEKPLSLVMIGHVHTGTMTRLNGGTVVITNSCLIPPDPFARSIGITSSSCGQWLFESVKGHIVGDARFIEVDFSTDKDASLDAIIQPYKGL